MVEFYEKAEWERISAANRIDATEGLQPTHKMLTVESEDGETQMWKIPVGQYDEIVSFVEQMRRDEAELVRVKNL